MEVRSESGIMSGREPFNVGLQKTLVASQPQMAMRVAYTSDGTTVYQPMPVSPPYQGGGAGGGGGGGVAAATSAGGQASAQSIPTHGININMGEPMKRKRGRPRKYGPDGTMALALTPVAPPGSGGFPSSAPAALRNPTSPSTAAALKKVKARPAGSGRKQQMDALGSGGIGFTPHVITVKAGEDLSSKIMSFSQHGPRAICILSANGAISNVTLRQAATSGGTVTYEGRFEILSLSGSFLPSDNDGQRSRTGGLSVSLAGPDGRVLGGGVAGILTAASPVQVVVGSFIAYGRKEMKPKNPLDPASAPGKLAAAPLMRAASPPSRGTMSESSGGGAGSPPINQSTSASNHNTQQGGLSNMPSNHNNQQGGLSNMPSNHSNQQGGLSNMPWK